MKYHILKQKDIKESILKQIQWRSNAYTVDNITTKDNAMRISFPCVTMIILLPKLILIVDLLYSVFIQENSIHSSFPPTPSMRFNASNKIHRKISICTYGKALC